MIPEEGSKVRGRYKIINKIAKGGMGAVYLAHDLLKNRQVALKVSFYGNEPKARKGFEHEAKLLARLDHPGLPKVRDYIFEEDNFQALVMDYIEGETLQDIFESGKYRVGRGLDYGKVVDWAIQILDILIFLHSHKPPVVHRDIKPDNLKLTPEGKIMLLDFGLAKGFAQSMIGGRSNYSALEQMSGTGTDPRSDIYALGATLYQLLSGDYPLTALNRFREIYGQSFQAKTELTSSPLLKSDPLMTLEIANPQIPPPISRFVAKAMELTPENRFQSAVEMKFSLQIAFQKSLGDSKIFLIERIGAETVADSLNNYNFDKSLIDEKEESLNFSDTSENSGNSSDENNESALSAKEKIALRRKSEFFPKTVFISDNPPPILPLKHTSFDPKVTTLPIQTNTDAEIPTLPPSAKRKKSFKRIFPLIAAGVFAILMLSGGIVAWQFGFFPDGAAKKNTDSEKMPVVFSSKAKTIEVSTYLVDEKKRSKKNTDENYLFEEKEKFRFGVKPATDGFLYIVSKDDNNKANRVFPESKKDENTVKKDVENIFPIDDGTLSLDKNSPPKTWVYFVIVAKKDDQTARKIMDNLNFDTDKNLSSPEVREVFDELDNLAENKNDEQSIHVKIVKLEKKLSK